MWDDKLIMSMQSKFNHVDFGTKGADFDKLSAPLSEQLQAVVSCVEKLVACYDKRPIKLWTLISWLEIATHLAHVQSKITLVSTIKQEKNKVGERPFLRPILLLTEASFRFVYLLVLMAPSFSNRHYNVNKTGLQGNIGILNILSRVKGG